MTLADYEPTIRQVIASAVHDGTVSSNDTRPLFARDHPEIPGQHIGQVYRKLQREGTLIRNDYVLSTDVDGGNVGKMIPSYKVTRPITALALIQNVQKEPTTVRPTQQRFPEDGPCAGCQTMITRYGPAGRPLCDWCAA